MIPDTPQDIVALARRHGLALVGEPEINDIGLDFRAAFASDEAGRAWVLRVPRRADVLPRAENEARVLRFLKGRLPVVVPDWHVFTPELIAYPLLPGKPVVAVDPVTRQPSWNIDKDSPDFARSFGRALAALHGVSTADANGLKTSSPEGARKSVADEIDRIKREVGIGDELGKRYRAWLDDDTSWPPFTALIHGDLHAGHVLVDDAPHVTGVLDWTEAEVGDTATDFIFHLVGFGADGLDHLLAEYSAAGGRTWPGMRHHIGERLAAFPVKYALFALMSGSDQHMAAARAQLGVE